MTARILVVEDQPDVPTYLIQEVVAPAEDKPKTA
jgi:hypothetical protein